MVSLQQIFKQTNEKNYSSMKKRIILTVAVSMATAMSMTSQTLPYQDKSLSFHERAKDLVSRLSLEEKAAQMGNMVDRVISREDFKDEGRVELPMYQYWNEALHGVARSGAATSFPESKAMSSSWDRQLIYDCASITSDEARIYHTQQNKGLNYWCPTINMARDPRWGRDEENYGEDPFLAGSLAVAFIKGMQGEQTADNPYFKTVACAKHFAANNYEQGRQGSTSFMSEHILREYYLPAFEMSVKEGHVQSIMSAYNAISTDLNEKNAAGIGWSSSKSWGGKPCAMNDWLLTNILRDEWGFDGYVTSDCAGISCIYRPNKHRYYGNYDESTDTDIAAEYAARATGAAIQAGNDMNCEFKNRLSVYQTAVEAAIDKGYMTEADLDSALVRVLESRFALGEFDTDVAWNNIPASKLECAEHQAMALKAAQEAIVLLKNEAPQNIDQPLLPLTTDKKIAIIGPYANQIMLGDYSGTPTYTTTPFQAISKRMNFTLSDGTYNFVDYDVLGYAKRGENKFKGTGYIENTTPGDWIVFNEIDFGEGCKDFVVNCATKKGSGEGTINFFLDLDDSKVAEMTEADAALSVSNSSIAAGAWGTYADVKASVDPDVFKGKHKVTIKLMGSQSYVGNWRSFRFYNEGHEPLEEQGPLYMLTTTEVVNAEADAAMIARAKTVAQRADVVVFIGGTDFTKPDNHATGTESHDRWQLTLPGNQEQLLQELYQVNPNVVLVLETNSSMDISWAKANIPAIMEAWYDGQAQGQAISDVLFGDFNPGGKLTSTWYNNISELPSANDSQFKANGMLEYNIDEWGYTYMYYGRSQHQAQAEKPMYPFGYGLSYTTFGYSNLVLSQSTLSSGQTLTIQADITNTGTREGAEVVQVYVSFPGSSVSHRPTRKLVGFDRVELAPGQTKTVSIPLSHEQLAYYNEATHTFDVESGVVNVYVSASSADDRLSGQINATGGTVKETYLSGTTGIGQHHVTTAVPVANDVVYDMTGMAVGTAKQMDRLPKGIYVVNGKKVVK